MGRKMKRWNGLIKGITAFIMAAVIAMSQIPGMDFVLIAYADNDKTITGLCTGAIGNPTVGAGGWSYVYYGKYDGNAMKYRVLDTAATQFGTEKTMLLDCDSTITNKSYHTAGDSVSWAGSNIKDWLNGSEFYGNYENTDVFTRQEQAAVASSTKGAAAAGDGDGWSLLNYAPLEGEHIFFLDAKEATRSSYGYANSDGVDTNRKKAGSAEWWLRSVAKQDVYGFGGHAGYVNGEGQIIHDQGVKNYGVSPAFNLNLKSVIFSSLIPDKTNEFKLTVNDNNMTIAKKDGSNVTRAGNVVTVPYKISGINDEAATQVSVLLTDEEYGAGVAATEGFSYLKLNVGSWGTSGTGTFTLPADYANKTCGEDYYAYILAETVNDGTATDYASAPATITIPDATAEQVATPTFSPAEGTYTEAQNVTISCTTDGATIHYTTDGTAPTAANSTYSSPINVSGTITIKAIAVKTGMTDSSVVSARYTISDTPVDTCTITFEPNGGRGSMEHQTVDRGVRTRLNRNSFTRSGYSFDGWNTRADGSGTGYEDRDYVTVNDNTTLYAQWTKDKPKPDPKEDDDDHDDEPAPSNNNNTKVPDGRDELRQSLSSAIPTAAVSGKPQTVYWNKGTSLPYDVMKMLHDNPNVTLVFSYTYLGQNYTVTIPGSAAIANPAVPWYGPVYLYALYGNTKISALTTNTKATTGNYTVKSDDTLSAIAKRLKTTVKHLKDVNNIKDVDRIKPGMVLKY